MGYRAFDTDQKYKDKKSDKMTGQVGFDQDEFVRLNDEGMAALLSPATKGAAMTQYPYIYRWLDTRIPILAGGNGAGGVRQAGRTMFFLNFDQIYNSLRTAISNLLTGQRVKSLNIYILSGISGGTGSGTFLDMAYVVRDIAKSVVLPGGPLAGAAGSVRVFGYLLMPDVNLLNADDTSRNSILLNAGTALQELEHAMNLKDTGDLYQCQYSNTYTVRTDERPFDYVHLICAKAAGGYVPAEPYKHCCQTVAGSILSFVAGQKKADGPDGVAPEQQFPVDSYYSNIGTHAAATPKTYQERSNCYLSVGYASWQIPADHRQR